MESLLRCVEGMVCLRSWSGKCLDASAQRGRLRPATRNGCTPSEEVATPDRPGARPDGHFEGLAFLEQRWRVRELEDGFRFRVDHLQ